MTARTLPENITSYDLLKSFAVVIMVIDHIGWYFYPDDLWWRAVGRIGFPVWFFLIGYAQSRALGWKIWAGAALLLLGNMATGLFIFPLNALVTIILIRLIIDPLMKMALYDVKALFAYSFVFLLLVFYSASLVEYGTQALAMAMLGYMVRHRERLELPNDVVTVFMGYAIGSFLILQYYMFGFSQPQLMAMIIGSLLVMGSLYFFKTAEYPALTEKLPRPLTFLIQLGGRRTLEIYVAHLLLFKALGLVLQPDRFAFMDWSLFLSMEN